MPHLPLRTVTVPDATNRVYDAWLAEVEGRLGEPGADWSRLTRDLLYQLYYPGFGDYDERLADPKTPPGRGSRCSRSIPGNITLEPEYYADVDQARFARVKPLLWLWYSFDRSPLGGQNVHLGVRFRRLLARPPLRAAAAGTSSASSSPSSPTATTSRWATTSWSTATCCWMTAAASRWATG